MTRSLCIVHRNVDARTSIGTLSAWAARTALKAGWRVTVVAEAVDVDLVRHVEVLPLWTPPRIHVLQWAAARATVAAAIRGRRFDVVHVHQPQLAPLANILQLHMLVSVALSVAPAAQGARQRLQELQYQAVARLEDRALRGLSPELILAPVSDYLSDHYAGRYGFHPRTHVLMSPVDAPAQDPSRTGGSRVLRLAFLGGSDPRKGFDLVLRGLVGVPDVQLVWAGHGSREAPAPPGLDLVRLGHVGAVADMLRDCDALIVASRFDPGAIVVTEALSQGKPVVFTRDVGYGSRALDAGAGVLWDQQEPLSSALHRLRRDLRGMSSAALLWAESQQGVAEQELLALYDLALRGHEAGGSP